MKKDLEKIKASHNKNVQVVIGKPLMRWGRELFDERYPILRYPAGTKIGRIFIDIGICKSWSQFEGTHWKNYEIPKGFTDLLLDGLKVQKYDMADRDDLSGFTPHRISILNLAMPWEELIKRGIIYYGGGVTPYSIAIEKLPDRFHISLKGKEFHLAGTCHYKGNLSEKEKEFVIEKNVELILIKAKDKGYLCQK